MTYIIIAALALLLIYIFTRKLLSIASHWQTFLDSTQISTVDFYDTVKESLKEREITHVDITNESFLEKHILSAKRLYLRITQNEYVIYICAAPYGTGTFFSSWLCIKDETFINRIPLLSKLIGKDRKNKTFYQMDTEAMFRTAVHATVVATIDSITEAKGVRGLTELDKQYKDIR